MANALKMHMIRFGEQLKTIRENAGMTQKDAAKKFGVSLSTYRRLEQGKAVDALGDILTGARP